MTWRHHAFPFPWWAGGRLPQAAAGFSLQSLRVTTVYSAGYLNGDRDLLQFFTN
jgi:hypothetical protein